MKDKTIRVKTKDNWYGNFDGDEVELSFFKLDGKPVTYRVCLWGNDDLGMEKDFVSPNPEGAYRLFTKLASLPDVSTVIAKRLGMVSA